MVNVPYPRRIAPRNVLFDGDPIHSQYGPKAHGRPKAAENASYHRLFAAQQQW